MPEIALAWWVLGVAAAPAAAFVLVATHWLLGGSPGEKLVRRVVMAGNIVSLLCAGAVAVRIFAGMDPPGTVEVGDWFGAGGYAFELAFRVDALSITMMLLVAVVTGLIGHFSIRYLHGQPGFARFFLLLSLFAAGMQLLVAGASIDQLFVGWELVGLTSALLVGYFHTRRTPVEAAVRVFVTYRACDLGLLIGAVLLHQASGTSDLALAPAAMREHAGGAMATLVPMALLLAAMGKSAQLPVGGWLPRAMEGPTPSSALFYGALSVHAGVYLLLRAQPLFAASPLATTALVAVGAATAVHGTLVGRVQTDAKSSLAYATMTQVGVMIVEIGLVLTTLALVHRVSHELLRCLQLLRAPSALHDARALAAAGARSSGPPVYLRLLPESLGRLVYHPSLERFGLDALLERAISRPVLRLGLALDRVERRWIEVLTGESAAHEEELPATVRPAPATKARKG